MDLWLYCEQSRHIIFTISLCFGNFSSPRLPALFSFRYIQLLTPIQFNLTFRGWHQRDFMVRAKICTSRAEMKWNRVGIPSPLRFVMWNMLRKKYFLICNKFSVVIAVKKTFDFTIEPQIPSPGRLYIFLLNS